MRATALALALLCAGAAFAQMPPPADATAHHAQMMDDLATLLDLSATQKPQVQAILQQEHAQMKQAFESAKASGSKPDVSQMHALHQQLQQDTIQKLTPVLTSAQLAKFQILMKMQHAHMHQHGPPPGDAPPAN
jgi:ABC-type glycerol-3-phosphate transport system substrate-binding protein